MKNNLPALLSVIAALGLAPATAEANSGDFSGGVAIGTGYAGVDTAPTSGVIIQGNVGIGTTNPISPVTIDATTPNYEGQVTLIDPLDASTSANLGVVIAGYGNDFVAGTNTGRAWAVGTGGSGTTMYVDQLQNAPLALLTAGTQRMNILGNGNIGIGNPSPSYLLHVGSSAASGAVAGFQNSADLCTLTPAASTPTWSCSSDMRLKTDIADTGDALAWLRGVRIRDFTMKATGERQTGVIAQELVSAHPDMVRIGANGFLAVDSPNPWMLVKAI